MRGRRSHAGSSRCYVSAVLVIALLAWPGAAEAGPPRWLVRATCGAAGGLAMGEIVGTERCLQRGSCREQNPIMPKGTGASDALGRAALKSAGTYAVLRVGLATPTQPSWWRFGLCAGTAAGNGYLLQRVLRR